MSEGEEVKTLGFYSLRLFIVSLLGLLAGCPNPNGTATIRYEQLGACNGYKEGNNVVSAGPEAAYVIFRVNNLDNRSGKVDFPYDPAKLCSTAFNPSACVSTSLSLAQKIGALATTATTIPAGKDLPHNGFAVIVVPTGSSPDPQVEANKVNYLLSYASSSSEPGVLLDKQNAKTQYQGVQDCLTKVW
ncbi:hypothetical protein ACFPTX_20670 [Pseudomonas sp. GCM10022188]|uniref:hypothetical protein n=1 Tax=Pseudomonas TaxID=286 RepID=UPI001E5C23ED|nr:hypothetical protein [Pseudomonas oryzagri]MCC6075404.1 hypothetical protein [Pseudomonas oryzagri]